MCLNKFVDLLKKWRFWILPLTILLYVLGVIIIVPIFITQAIKDGFHTDHEVYIGGIFVLLALPISFWEIIQHVIHFTQPKLQKHIIRILWMVPIYAINAWLGLVSPEHSIYADSARECYEAYVIYNFMIYLLNYLNMEMDLEASLELKPQVYHIFPLCCLPPWTMGREFVHLCKHGILQYTVVRPLTTFISFICKLSGVYGDGIFHWNVAFPYIITINNFSQFVAMYCLVLFYKANIAELKPMKPLAKFLCIKAVVFFSFFDSELFYSQGILIDLLVAYFFQQDTSLSTRLQDFLICIEMCMAAIAHHYSFSHEPYVRPGENQSCCRSFLAMWDVSDMSRDIQEHIGIVRSSISRRIRGRSMYQMARGDDEWSSLVTRPSTSVPTNILYQNEPDDPINSYGSVNKASPVSDKKSEDNFIGL